MKKALLVLGLAGSLACAQTPMNGQFSGQPGLTVMIYQLEGTPPAQMPTLVTGQTPNVYEVLPTFDLTTLNGQEGPLKTNFMGTATGALIVPKAGQIKFRLTADDYAELNVGGVRILEAGVDGSSAEGSTTLSAAWYPLSVNLYQRGGGFRFKLEWMLPGEKTYHVLNSANLMSDAGQTFVVAPGPKKWFSGKDTSRPGDGRPLIGVHPSFTLQTFRPDAFKPAVGGMCFLPDGTLAICTWDQVGAVYFIRNLHKRPQDVKITRFAEGLGEPLGIAYYKGDLYITQKREVTRLRDTNKDGVCDRYDVVAQGWPMSHNYHEFSFNLQPKNGKFYISTSVPLRGGWTYYNPGSTEAFPLPGAQGSILEIDPVLGTWKIFARGLRTPNGMGMAPDGTIFVCDNQGSWLASSKINQVMSGGFYGHQLSPHGTHPTTPPVCWVPQNEIGNSPSQPVFVPKGIYKGQMMYGDVTHGGIKRVYLQKVDGRYQGCIFRFTQGIEAGVNRLVWGPDGSLYVGGIGSNGNWNHENKRFGLQRLVPNSTSTFEMLKCEALPKGFRVTFTQPVAPGAKLLEFRRWRYGYSENYGGPKLDQEALKFSLTWSRDRRSVMVTPSSFKPGFVHYLRWSAVNAKKQPLWATEAWFTLNWIPKS